MKQINVIGYCCYDIVMYLAAVLRELGARVAVVDESDGQQLFEYLPEVIGMSGFDPIELRGVKYACTRSVVDDEQTDYVFTIKDSAQCMKDGECCLVLPRTAQNRDWIFVTDEDARHVLCTEKVLEAVQHMESEAGQSGMHAAIRIIRGYTGVMKEHYGELVKGGKSEVFTLPYNAKDRKAELFLEIREDICFKPVSERLSSVIEKIIYRLRPGTKVAEFERAYNVMMKGGAFR